MTLSDERPQARDRRADVPDGFIPVYVPGQHGRPIAAYRCTKGSQEA
jgi:hypothetical protein